MPTMTIAQQAATKARSKGLGAEDGPSDSLRDPLMSDGGGVTPRVGVRQKERSLDGLRSAARATEGHFMDVVMNIAASTGGKTSFPGLKKLKRTAEKIGEDYAGESGRITDLVRGSITYKSIEGAESGLSRIEALEADEAFKSISKVEDKKQRFLEPGGGYKDINVKIRMGNGMVVELQLAVTAIDQAKHEGGHAVYDVIRTMEPKLSDYSVEEQADYAEFIAFQDEIYATATDLAKAGGEVSADQASIWKSDPRMTKVEAYKTKLGV
jgi:hypothetical protein